MVEEIRGLGVLGFERRSAEEDVMKGKADLPGSTGDGEKKGVLTQGFLKEVFSTRRCPPRGCRNHDVQRLQLRNMQGVRLEVAVSAYQDDHIRTKYKCVQKMQRYAPVCPFKDM